MVNRVAVIRVPESAEVPPASIPAPEWSQVKTDVNALARNLYNPDSYGAVRDDPSAATANVSAIQAAADNAHANDGVLVIKGTYWIDDTVQARCHVDGTSGTLRTSNESIAPALLVGSRTNGSSEVLRYKTIHLPTVMQMGRTGPGWSGLDTGVEIANAYSCQITLNEVNGFSTNVWFSAYGTGCVMNTLTLGMIYNGKVGLRLGPGNAGGWVNQNTVIGGQIGIQSAEGTSISGSRYIQIDNAAFPVNSNTFIAVDLESGMPEYRVWCAGSNNMWLNCRWEKNPAIVRFDGTNAVGNQILYGNNSFALQMQQVNGARYNIKFHRGGITGDQAGGQDGVFVMSNTGSAAWPVLTVMGPGQIGAGADPQTAYYVRMSAHDTQYKDAPDTDYKAKIDHRTGRILGTGLGTAGYATGAPSGSPKGSVPIYAQDGTLLGRIPVY